MDKFLLQMLSVIVGVCIVFFYFYKSQKENNPQEEWEEEEVEILTAEDPDKNIFMDSIKKGPCVYTGTTIAFDKIQHYPLSELNKMEEHEKFAVKVLTTKDSKMLKGYSESLYITGGQADMLKWVLGMEEIDE